MPRARMPERLETDRLVLRRRDPDEAAVYRQLWTERDPRVPAHRRLDAEGRPTVDDIAAQILGDARTAERDILAVQRKDTGDVIGYCGLIARSDGSPDEPELAYEVLSAAHGQGYATEAGGAVVAWAGQAGCPRLWAGVWDWNTASRRVLQKLGFREMGAVEPRSVHGSTIMTVREFARPSASADDGPAAR